jgi:hypothetical protein
MEHALQGPLPRNVPGHFVAQRGIRSLTPASLWMTT